MNKCMSLARTVFVGMAVALLIAALTPTSASAGSEKTNGQDKMNDSSHGMKDTGMAKPSDMSSPGMKESGKGKVIKADNMDRKKLRAELDAASDDTVIEYKGKKTTKKQLKTEAEKRAKEDRKAMEARPASASGGPDSVISQFDQAEKAKLDTANAKVRAEMTRLMSANPAVEGAAGQANPASPAAGSQRQRSLPMQPDVR